MTNDDRTAFAEVILGFAELKGRELTAPALELYWRALRHWSLEEFRQAAEHLLRTCEFMPTPKDFEDLRRAGEPTAHEAWAIAYAACGGWRMPDPTIDPRILRAAACVGGLRAIAMADTERDLPHIQRRFLEAYEDLRDVEPVRERLPQIATRVHLRGPVQLGKAVPVRALEDNRR